MCTTSIHPDVTLDSNQRLANLGSYATDLLTQSFTESPYMNVDFYSHGRELLHQNCCGILAFSARLFLPGLVRVEIISVGRRSMVSTTL